MRNLIAVSVLLLAGCATQPDKISASYVSTLQYDTYNCPQLSAELTRVNTRASALKGSLKKTADNDAAQMGLGLILFWPTLFFLEGGDGPQAQEYARLKGEREAIESSAIQKSCGTAVAQNVVAKQLPAAPALVTVTPTAPPTPSLTISAPAKSPVATQARVTAPTHLKISTTAPPSGTSVPAPNAAIAYEQCATRRLASAFNLQKTPDDIALDAVLECSAERNVYEDALRQISNPAAASVQVSLFNNDLIKRLSLLALNQQQAIAR